MAVPVILADAALRDLEEIQLYYIEQGLEAYAERLLIAIFAKLEQLEKHPVSGRIVPEFDEPYLRELIHAPFRIIYRLNEKQIQVVRIWRSERRLSGRHIN